VTKTIALAGKGGTGKTTVAALLTRAMLHLGFSPILAIDADPATNLHMALGLPEPATIGETREEMAQAALAGQLGVTISRHDYLSREVRMALEEGDQIDLLAMGRPEGQGCYCAVNHVLRTLIDDLQGKYPLVIIDNEAGMEHISRRTTRDVDVLLVVTDPTLRGVRAAASIIEMARSLEVNVRDMQLIINRLDGPLPAALAEAIAELKVPVGAQIPADPLVGELDALGEPLIRLDGASPAVAAVEALARKLASEP
jgi:CO dehydrogenase maturation factor